MTQLLSLFSQIDQSMLSTIPLSVVEELEAIVVRSQSNADKDIEDVKQEIALLEVDRLHS